MHIPYKLFIDLLIKLMFHQAKAPNNFKDTTASQADVWTVSSRQMSTKDMHTSRNILSNFY